MKEQKDNVIEKTVLRKDKKRRFVMLASGFCGALIIAGSLIATGCRDTSDDGKVKYTFNTMGGAAIAEVVVDPGTEYLLPTPEAREGYLFEGWYTSETFEGLPVTTVEAQSSQTYYAKWTQLSKITLNLDGGTLAQTSLYLRAGENLYDFMQNYQPTKEGLTFGGWFNGNNALSATTKMPQDGIELTAKYKVKYTVEVYVQDLNDETQYVLDEDKTFVGSDFVGKTVTSEKPKIEGCEENATHADRVVSKTLSEKASENVFKYYFNRGEFTITFVVRYPDGTEENEITVTKKYGEWIEDAPDTYTAEGYCLIGWGERDAEVPQYQVYAVDKALQNGDGTERKPEAFTPTENLVLYSVWAKGYTDMFSGDDYLFFLEKTENGDVNKEIIYLSRGNQFFKGEYDEDYNEFYFVDPENTNPDGSAIYILTGKLYENNKFAYTSTKRSRKIAYMYTMGVGLDESVQLKFDEINGVTYISNGDETKGTQQMNDDGEYIADFTSATSGLLKGKKLTFLLGTYDNKSAFIPLKEEERDFGTLKRFYFNAADKTLETYTNGFGDITLDGYGNATYNNGSQLTRYYYTYEDEVITLTSQYGGLFGKAILMENKGKKGYVLYTQWQDREFQVDGGTLVLDGGIKATYTVGSTTVEGYYNATESLFNGYVINVDTDDNQKYTFIISDVELDDDGNLKNFQIKKVLNSYAEYRYLADGRVYNAAAIVLDETKEGYLSLYGYNSRLNEFVKVSEGPYQKSSENEKDPYYQYTVETAASGVEGILTSPVNPANIQSFVFALDSETTAYSLFYWQSSVSKDEPPVETEYVVEYECATDDEASLKLVGGFAYYTTKDGLSVSGAYGKSGEDETYIVILTSSIAGNVNYYVDLDEENKTFIPLEYAPYTAYLYGADGDFSSDENAVRLIFDGKGNAVYVDKNGVEVEGTVRLTDNKTGNVNISEFKANDNSLTISYIGGLSVGNASAFLLYNDTYNGEYKYYDKANVEIGSLELDGYGYLGKYLDNDGVLHEGTYLIQEDGAVALQDSESGKTWYFDITERKFTVRSEEYGEYLWVKNRDWQKETYFELNGYGKLSVYTKTKNVDEETDEVTYTKNYIAQEGTYEQIGDMFVLRYTADTTPVTLYGELGTYASSKAFLEKLEDDDPVIGVYVNKADWSVLILDGVGNAIKYAGKEDDRVEVGQKQTGYYTLITEDLLYFVNTNSTDACLYEYDSATKTATQVTFNTTRYFSKDMELLTFYKYGYFIVTNQDGETERYFYQENYEMVGDVETVVGLSIYQSDPDNDNANAYGFVESTVQGGYGETFAFQEKIYYKNNNELVFFNRDNSDVYETTVDGETVSKLTYPLNAKDFGEIDLDIPENMEFEQKGRIAVGGTKNDCVVVREKNENDEWITYIEFGNYRIYVEFNYQGVSSTNETSSSYKITGMEFHQTSYAKSYLDTYAYYAGFGYRIDNTLGEITVHGTYNADGTAENVVVDAQFLEDSSVKDMNGELITFENATYIDHGVNASYGQHYEAVFTAKDGNTYSLHFIVSQHSQVRAYAFNVLALTRHQDFTELADGYEIATERVMYSEYSTYEKGDLFGIKLFKDGNELVGEPVMRRNNIIQFIDGCVIYTVREKDTNTNQYTADTYYVVELLSDPLIENTDGTVEIPFYTSGRIASIETMSEILYAEGGKYFVEFINNKPKLLCMANETFVVTESKTLTQEQIAETFLPTDGSTIKAAYEVTSPTSTRKFMVQIREKTVDGVTVTYAYVADIYE